MTYKFKEFFFKEYTRMSKYLKPGDFIQINDPDGFVAYMKVVLSEPMAMIPILFADELSGIAAKGVRAAGGAVIPPVPMGAFVAMEFLTPNREDRLIQARPVIFALYRPTDPPNPFDGQMVPPQPQFSDVLLQWTHPFQDQRGGTDKAAPLVVNINSASGGIPQNPGGSLGGVVNALDIYSSDDPNEDYDLWVISGTEPGYRILNNSPAFPIGLGASPNVGLDYDWYLAFVGYKYIIEPVTSEELTLLKNYKLKFTPIGVGGVPQASAIRAGGV